MNILIIANIVALLGSLLMVGVGLIKTKKNILLAQSLQCLLMGIANLLLGGMTGFCVSIISIFRNLYVYKFKYTIIAKIVFIAFLAGFGIAVNNLGIMGWLPVASVVVFTWFLDLEDEIKLKIVIVITTFAWIVYDFYMRNYSAFTFDILTVISNIIGIFRVKKYRMSIKTF